MSNIFITNITIKDSNGNTEYQNSDIYYSLEEALESGKNNMKFIYDNFCEETIDIDAYMNSKDYYFFIYIISGNRIKFNSCKDLMMHYEKNIKSYISNYIDLYNFLLSLVKYDYRSYDYKGNLILSHVMIQQPSGFLGCNVKFSIESCNNNDYKFEYRYKD